MSSRMSDAGWRPAASVAACTLATRSGASSWRADRFTLICHVADGLAASHVPSCSHACSSTRWPSGTIRPVSSAIGTNSAGDTGAPLRVVPAGQRLEGDDLAGVEAHDRLVGDVDVALLHRPLELAADREAVDGAVVHRRLEHLDAALAVRLGRVHGEVGVAEQLVGRGGGPEAGGDADAGPGVHLTALDHDRLVQGVEDPLGHLDHGLRVGRVLEEHRELVTAEASRGVARAQAAAEPVGHRPQQLVAGAVAEAVVDELEVVEVDEGDRGDRRVGCAGCGPGRARRGRGRAPGSTGR